jgi:hypothetical protein
MKNPNELFDDERPIVRVDNIGTEQTFVVGREGVTAIKPHRECGEMAYIPWVLVYAGDEIAYRFPANYCCISYVESEGE